MIKYIKKIFRVKEWSDWPRVVSFFQYFTYLCNKFFVEPFNEPKKTKDFDLVIKKYDLNEESLTKQSQALKTLSLILLCFAFCILFYGIYHLIFNSLLIGLVIVCISLVGFSLAFRYHFYHTAIQQRRLNLTIQEWFASYLRKE